MSTPDGVMTAGERRRARKAARAAGRPLTGDLALMRARETSHEGPAVEWTETARGARARDRWARRYDALHGAPEGDGDR